MQGDRGNGWLQRHEARAGEPRGDASRYRSGPSRACAVPEDGHLAEVIAGADAPTSMAPRRTRPCLRAPSTCARPRRPAGRSRSGGHRDLIEHLDERAEIARADVREEAVLREQRDVLGSMTIRKRQDRRSLALLRRGRLLQVLRRLRRLRRSWLHEPLRSTGRASARSAPARGLLPRPGMKPFVVLYATREGQTRRVAEHIAELIQARGHEAKLRDVSRDPPSEPSRSSWRLPRRDPRGVGPRRQARAGDDRVREASSRGAGRDSTAFLSVSLAAAGAADPEQSAEARAKAAADCRGVVDKLVAATVAPCAHRARRGALAYSKYNFLIRFVMKRIAKSQSMPTDTARGLRDDRLEGARPVRRRAARGEARGEIVGRARAPRRGLIGGMGPAAKHSLPPFGGSEVEVGLGCASPRARGRPFVGLVCGRRERSAATLTSCRSFRHRATKS